MRWSEFFLYTQREDPQDAESVSHRLMIRAGLIRRLASGTYSYLPLGLKVLRKVEGIVREEMDKAGTRELLLPALQPKELWERSGRFQQLGEDMFSFRDRHGKGNVLGPTHEEVITSLVQGEVKSYRQLPVILYQIQTKFRDEARPRFGVIRSREFLMKDAYSFDVDEKGLEESYRKMFGAYKKIFSRCGLSFFTIQADPGVMGGKGSDEFLVPSQSGEDMVRFCSSCRSYAAAEGGTGDAAQGGADPCPSCGKPRAFQRAIEIGHVFKLGTRYTQAFEATFLDESGKRSPILMGCYGIGVSRVVAAVVEGHHDAFGIRWPLSLAPFEAIIVPVVEDRKIQRLSEKLYTVCQKEGMDVLLDDRPERAGIKFKDADLIGIPIQIVLGKTTLEEGKVEIRVRGTDRTVRTVPTQAVAKVRGLLRSLDVRKRHAI